MRHHNGVAKSSGQQRGRSSAKIIMVKRGRNKVFETISELQSSPNPREYQKDNKLFT